MKYQVQRSKQQVVVDGNAKKPVWAGIPPVKIETYLDKPEFAPVVTAKAQYDAEAIYVLFEVQDQYVRAVAQKYHDSVCQDSCVEFFFIPGKDKAKGYFNIEINCGGTLLFHYQLKPGKPTLLAAADCDQVTIAHTLPKIVEPEITKPTAWVIECRVPFAVLEKYAAIERPGPGVEWKANFYKCADKTSHPHWLAWSPLAGPPLSFHRPECFGELIFA